MTNTDTADVETTAQQCLELAAAGSEMVRITVNVPEAAAAVPEIKQRMLDAGCDAPLIGDFHYNGHVLLTKYPRCAAAALDKYRINPGNVGAGKRRDEQFSTICKVARDHGKPVRIGVNGGSLNQELVMRKMQENTDRNLGHSDEIINECMVLSALESTELALECGLRDDQIIISCKVSRPAAPDHRLSRARRAHPPAAAPRPYRGRHGPQGRHLVGDGHGHSAE